MEQRLYLNCHQMARVKMVDRDIFRLFQDGIGYELESFISDALTTRDTNCLGGDKEQLFRNMECLDFLIRSRVRREAWTKEEFENKLPNPPVNSLCKKRIKELDILDAQFAPAEFVYFCQAAHGLRQVHRSILDTSIVKYAERHKKTKLFFK